MCWNKDLLLFVHSKNNIIYLSRLRSRLKWRNYYWVSERVTRCIVISLHIKEALTYITLSFRLKDYNKISSWYQYLFRMWNWQLNHTAISQVHWIVYVTKSNTQKKIVQQFHYQKSHMTRAKLQRIPAFCVQ